MTLDVSNILLSVFHSKCIAFPLTSKGRILIVDGNLVDNSLYKEFYFQGQIEIKDGSKPLVTRNCRNIGMIAGGTGKLPIYYHHCKI